MASLTAASLSVPSFCGLRASEPTSKLAPCSLPLAPVRICPVSASLSPLSKTSSAAFVAAAAAATLLASSSPALAAKIDVGDEVGSFKFSPDSLTVSAGEPIIFTLVGETPHNIIFDIPSGAPASVVKELTESSMGENDLLTEDENTFKAKISTPGVYTYYCTPHKSSNMKGSISVK